MATGPVRGGMGEDNHPIPHTPAPRPAMTVLAVTHRHWEPQVEKSPRNPKQLPQPRCQLLTAQLRLSRSQPPGGQQTTMPYLWEQHRCHSGHPGSQLVPPSSSSSGNQWSPAGPAAPCPAGAEPGVMERIPVVQENSQSTPSSGTLSTHPPSPQRSRPGAAGGTSCSPGSAQKLPPGWPGRDGEKGEHLQPQGCSVQVAGSSRGDSSWGKEEEPRAEPTAGQLLREPEWR